MLENIWEPKTLAGASAGAAKSANSHPEQSAGKVALSEIVFRGFQLLHFSAGREVPIREMNMASVRHPMATSLALSSRSCGHGSFRSGGV